MEPCPSSGAPYCFSGTAMSMSVSPSAPRRIARPVVRSILVERVAAVRHQGREGVIGDRHAPLEAAVDVEPGHHVRIESKLAGRHEDAVAWRRLDRDLVHHRIHIEERRRRRGLIQVVVRVRGAGDTGCRNWSGRWCCVGQRTVGDRHTPRIHVVRQVLARVADDAEAVGSPPAGRPTVSLCRQDRRGATQPRARVPGLQASRPPCGPRGAATSPPRLPPRLRDAPARRGPLRARRRCLARARRRRAGAPPLRRVRPCPRRSPARAPSSAHGEPLGRPDCPTDCPIARCLPRKPLQNAG